MKTSPCEVVAERVALAEPLAEYADHAASCARCRALAALPVELGVVRRDSEPGPGFTARIAAGAQRRITQRRRRRVAFASASIAMTAAAALVIVVRTPSPQPQVDPGLDTASNTSAVSMEPFPAQPISAADEDADVRALVHFARYERVSRVSASWSQITKPLAPYRQLVRGVRP
jgi:hypothetical protein